MHGGIRSGHFGLMRLDDVSVKHTHYSTCTPVWNRSTITKHQKIVPTLPSDLGTWIGPFHELKEALPITWLMASETEIKRCHITGSQTSSFHLILSKWERHIKGLLARLIFSIRTLACDLSVFHGLIPIRHCGTQQSAPHKTSLSTPSVAEGRKEGLNILFQITCNVSYNTYNANRVSLLVTQTGQ